MALRFYSEFPSYLGTDWRIEIHDTDFVGTETELTVSGGFSLNPKADGREFTEALMPTELTVNVVIQDPAETFKDDIVTSSETRFSVVLKKDGDFYWSGALVPDVGEIEDKGPKYGMALKAVCGLGLLADYEYIDETPTADKWTNTFSGFERLIGVVALCLKKLPHVQTHYAASTQFLQTVINWHHSGQPFDDPDNTNDPLYNVYVLQSVFSGVQTSGNAKPLSCAEVLEAIMTTFNARIVQVGGMWRIEQYESRTLDIGTNPADNRARLYNYDIDPPTVSGINPVSIEIDPGNSNRRLAGGTFGFAKGAKEAIINLDTKTRYNLTEAMRFDEASASDYNAGNVFWDGVASTFRAKGTITGNIENINLPSIFFAVNLTLVFKLKVNLQSNFLSQTVSYSGNIFNPTVTTMVWSGSTAYVEIPVDIAVAPAIGDNKDFSKEFDFTISTPTGTQGNLSVFFELDRVINRSTGATISGALYSTTWKMNNPYFAIYYDEDIAQGAQTFQVINNDYVNSATIKKKTILGDAIGLNDRGALRYLSGGDYLKTLDWSVRDSVDGFFISNLLGRRILQAQSTARRVINATIYGPDVSQFDLAIEYEGIRYLFMGGNFRADRDELSGTWIELRYEDIDMATAVNSDTDNSGSPATGSGTVNQNTGTGQAGGDGNGIYSGSGTVPAATTATVSSSFNMTRSGASAGDEIGFLVDDGTDQNQVKVEASTGVRIVSSGDVITFEGETSFADVISASTINANQNDYAALAGANVGRLTASAAYNITGIAGGSDGRVLFLHNVGTNNITLKNADTGSSAANRFDIGSDFVIASKKLVVIQYDATSARWRVVGGTSGSISGTADQVAVFTSSGIAGSANLTFDGDVLDLQGTINVDGSNGDITGDGLASFNFLEAIGANPSINSQDTASSSSTNGGQVIISSSDGAALASGDQLGALYYKGSAPSLRDGASIHAFTTALWTNTSSPAKLSLRTTPSGSITPTERVTIGADGTLDVLYNIRLRALQIEDFNTITGTGTVTASSTITDNLYKNGSTQATLTFNLPASPTDGQICKVSFNDIITALTVSGNGETINGTLPTSAAVGSSYEFKFYHAIPAWIRKY